MDWSFDTTSPAGIASSFYGEPRFTQDLDLVVQLSAGGTETGPSAAVVVELPHRSSDRAGPAIRRKSIFQAIDGQSAIKIGLSCRRENPRRIAAKHAAGVLPGLTIPLVFREDAILSKLLWIQLGSEKSKRDAMQMLGGAENLDWTRLREEALRLGLATELSRIEEAAQSGGDKLE